MTKLSIAGLVLLLVSSCASSKKDFGEPKVVSSKRHDTQKIYPSSFSQVWDSTLKTLNEQNFPLLVSQRDRGLVVTDWIVEKSDQLFSSYAEAKVPYKIRYKMQIDVKPTRRGVLIKVQSREQYLTDVITSGMEFQGSLYRWLDTESTGKKESKLLDAIYQKLGTAPSS